MQRKVKSKMQSFMLLVKWPNNANNMNSIFCRPGNQIFDFRPSKLSFKMIDFDLFCVSVSNQQPLIIWQLQPIWLTVGAILNHIKHESVFCAPRVKAYVRYHYHLYCWPTFTQYSGESIPWFTKWMQIRWIIILWHYTCFYFSKSKTVLYS